MCDRKSCLEDIIPPLDVAVGTHVHMKCGVQADTEWGKLGVVTRNDGHIAADGVHRVYVLFGEEKDNMHWAVPCDKLGLNL